MTEMGFRVGVVGAGVMGALYARVVAFDPKIDLAWVADPDEQSLTALTARSTMLMRSPLPHAQTPSQSSVSRPSRLAFPFSWKNRCRRTPRG